MGGRGAGLAAIVLAVLLGGCSFIFEDPGVPDELPVPPSATVVVVDTAHDGDDPMDGRVQVIDAGATSVDELVAFYEAALPESAGWTRVDTSDGELLCLTRQNKHRYTEVFDLIPYNGSRVEASPGRYLAMTSRFAAADVGCEWGLRWVPGDLVRID